MINTQYVNSMDDFANDTPLSYTLREMREMSRQRSSWLVLAGVTLILVLAGPFGTYDAMTFTERAIYWTLIAFGGFGIGSFCSMLITTWIENHAVNDNLALLLGGALAGVPVAAYVALVGSVFFQEEFVGAFTALVPYCVPIVLIVAWLYELSATRIEPVSVSQRHVSDTSSAVWKKLPPEIGRDIVHIQAQDHYVRVTTTTGSTLILMTMNETEAVFAKHGVIRVHRSWCVRLAHVQALKRRNGQAFASMITGDEIPIGRVYRRSVLGAIKIRQTAEI